MTKEERARIARENGAKSKGPKTEEGRRRIACLKSADVDRLWKLVGELGPDEMVRAITALSSLQPAAARRLIALADQPVLQKLIGMR